MSDAAETYSILENDAFGWLEVATGLRRSALLSWNALLAIWHESQTLPDVREAKLAYVQSSMLLTAFSFENVCRGIAVLTQPEGWKFLQRWHGGHALVEPVKTFISISDRERDLLHRLETYLQWAGRYPIPNSAAKYVSAVEKGSRTITSNDLSLSNELFARLESYLNEIYSEQQARLPPFERWP